MTKERLRRIEDIKATRDKATPGPWKDNISYVGSPSGCVASADRNADVGFIAHSREDVDWLIEELEAAWRVHADLEAITVSWGTDNPEKGAMLDKLCAADQALANEQIRANNAEVALDDVRCKATRLCDAALDAINHIRALDPKGECNSTARIQYEVEKAMAEIPKTLCPSSGSTAPLILGRRRGPHRGVCNDLTTFSELGMGPLADREHEEGSCRKCGKLAVKHTTLCPECTMAEAEYVLEKDR